MRLDPTARVVLILSAIAILNVIASTDDEPAFRSVEWQPTPTPGECTGLQVAAGSDLQQVTASRPAGTTFCLAAGQFRVPSGITLQHGDVLQGAGRTKTFIVGTGAKNILRAESRAEVTVRALDISGGWGDGSCRPACGRAIEATGSAWLIQDVRCHDNDNQCVGGGGAAVTMVDSECDRNGFGTAFNSDGSTRSAACIKRATSGNGRLVVRNSYIHHNGWAGVWCDYCPNGPFIVENSILTDNASRAVSWEVSGGYSDADLAIVRDNVIQRNGLGDTRTVSAGITCNSCADLTVERNTFGGNANSRAVGFINAKRGPWGDIHGVIVRNNRLNGDSVNCSMTGVTCSGNS
jgi:hypothetical protein